MDIGYSDSLAINPASPPLRLNPLFTALIYYQNEYCLTFNCISIFLDFTSKFRTHNFYFSEYELL